jgi:DNA-binding beta-propeller fold protein YncE
VRQHLNARKVATPCHDLTTLSGHSGLADDTEDAPVSSLATTRNGHQRLSRSSRRVRRGTQAAALSLTLATGVASLLTAVPAQAADIYTVTAKIGIGVGRYPDSVAVSPDGTHIYVADFQYSGNLAVITRESVVTYR